MACGGGRKGKPHKAGCISRFCCLLCGEKTGGRTTVRTWCRVPSCCSRSRPCAPSCIDNRSRQVARGVGINPGAPENPVLVHNKSRFRGERAHGPPERLGGQRAAREQKDAALAMTLLPLLHQPPVCVRARACVHQRVCAHAPANQRQPAMSRAPVERLFRAARRKAHVRPERLPRASGASSAVADTSAPPRRLFPASTCRLSPRCQAPALQRLYVRRTTSQVEAAPDAPPTRDDCPHDSLAQDYIQYSPAICVHFQSKMPQKLSTPCRSSVAAGSLVVEPSHEHEGCPADTSMRGEGRAQAHLRLTRLHVAEISVRHVQHVVEQARRLCLLPVQHKSTSWPPPCPSGSKSGRTVSEMLAH